MSRKTKKRKNVLLKIVISLSIVYGLFYVIVPFLIDWETTYYPDLEQVSKLVEIPFSDKAELIDAELLVWIDKHLYAIVDVPEDELKQLFPEDKYEISTIERYVNNGSDLRSFTPDNVEHFKSFNYEKTEELWMLSVLYEDNDNPIRRVFISWCSD